MAKHLKQTGDEINLNKYVDGGDGIYSVRQINKIRSWNNIEYGAGLSGKNTPSTKLSMNRACNCSTVRCFRMAKYNSL